MPAKHLLSAAATLGASLALVACGGDSNDNSGSSQEPASAAVALKEAGETREGITAALATYKSGDKQAAEDQVSEAYLQHFEEVEHALEERDAELKEKLEEAINTDLRAAMKDGKPAAEVEAQVDAVVADLQKAEAALR
jgi:DNA-binding transcriptional MerR regulator